MGLPGKGGRGPTRRKKIVSYYKTLTYYYAQLGCFPSRDTKRVREREGEEPRILHTHGSCSSSALLLE